MLLFDKILTFNSKEGYIDTNNPESDPIITKKREIKALEPSQTLYVNNLNEKIKKDGKLSNFIICAKYHILKIFFRDEALTFPPIFNTRGYFRNHSQAESKNEGSGVYCVQ